MNRTKLDSRLRLGPAISDCRTAGNRKRRHGLTVTEIIVSAAMLATVMSFVGNLCFRVNLIWSDVNHHRIAVNELSNQLEVLTLMKPEQAATAIKSLKPSLDCSRALKSPELTGEIVEDELGWRVVLRLDWKRPNQSLPTELSGWIAAASEPSQTEKAEPEGEQ